MPSAKKHVLVIEHDFDVGDLLVMLLDSAGYDARMVLEADDPVAEARARHPDLLVVDMRPIKHGGGYGLLDALRANPETRRIPTVAITTAEPLSASAMPRYNIRATLPRPFNLDSLLTKVREALNEPPFGAGIAAGPPPPRNILAQAERLLHQHSTETVFRWVQRLRQEPPWRDRTDLELSEIVGPVPVLVEAVGDALRQYADPDEFLRSQRDIAERVRQYGVECRARRIPWEAVVREYSLLRDEIFATIWGRLTGPLEPEDAYALQRVIDGTLDKAVEMTIEAYDQGRRQASA
jgi:DNA-binding response OmpR family regulator